MRTKKITIAVSILLVIFFILSMLAPVFVNAAEILIYEKSAEETVTKGVTRKNIIRYTTDGWLNINVIKADLTEQYLSADLLTDLQGGNHMDNVLNLAQENNAVAAINADFFQRLRGTSDMGSSIGLQVKDGKLLSTPAHQEGMAVMSIDRLKNILFGSWTYQITITAPNNNTATAKHINKYDPLDSIVIYDRNWNIHSLGSDNNKVEVVVENGIVREIRREMPPVEIPENGYIICNLPEYDPFLIDNFQVGDPVQLDIVTQPDFKDLALGVGGGTMLVKDGQQVPFTHNIKGRHPRSAIGTDAAGKTLYLVTVDGRQLTSKGMTQEEMAALLIELGIHNAINLDGGGSTTLVSKTLGDDRLQVVNSASDGWLRKVTNAVGIKTSAPKAPIAGLVIESISENVFVNTSRAFTVKAYDQNYNPVPVDMNRIKWQCSDIEGTFAGNTFYPTTVGHGVIKATYQNASGTYAIDVLSSPSSIDIQPKRIDMQTGDKVKLTVFGKNRLGYSAPISLSDISWDMPNGIAAIEDNSIKALKGGVDILTATVDQVNTHASVAVDFGTAVDDFEKINGSFLPYPSYVEGDYTLSSEVKRNGEYAGKLTFDFTSDHEESRAAYFQYAGDGLVISPDTTKIGLWVYGSQYMQHWLRGGIRDKNDKFHRLTFARKIDWDGWKYIEAALPEDVEGPVRFTRLYVVQVDPEVKNKGAIYFDDLTFINPENKVENIVLPEDIRLPDELNKASAPDSGGQSLQFSVFGNTIDSSTLLENIVMRKAINTFNKSGSLAAFVGNIDPKTLEGLNTKYLHTSGHHMLEHEGSTFLYMDNHNDGFRKTNADQWVWFKNAIEEINNKNVFIFLPKPLTGEDGFTDIREAQLFKDMLTERLAKKGKNVFVFYHHNKTEHNIDRGVRYISIPGIMSVNADNIEALVEGYKYVLVTVNGDEMSYEIKNLFE